MGGGGEADPGAQFLPVGDEDHALTHLRDAVEGGVEQGVAGDVTFVAQHLAGLLRDVLTAMIQRVGDVLHQQRQRSERVHIVEILEIQTRP